MGKGITQIVAITLLALATANSSAQAGKNRNQPIGKEYLYQCVTLNESVERTRKEINLEIHNNNKLVPEINRLSKELRDMRSTMDLMEKDQMEKYKPKADRYDLIAKSYNDRQVKIRSLNEARNTTISDYNRICSGKRYIRDDLYNIQQGH